MLGTAITQRTTANIVIIVLGDGGGGGGGGIVLMAASDLLGAHVSKALVELLSISSI